MNLHGIDIAIVIAYLVSSVLVGYWVSNRASKDIKAYFLGGNVMPWYVLGISNASGMFDISGTMLLVYWMFVYGLKSVWIPWLVADLQPGLPDGVPLHVAEAIQCDDRRRVDSDTLR